MITKILFLLAEIVRHQLTAIRPQNPFQKRFEWQSEFLFVREKQPFHPVSPASKTCLVSDIGNPYLRSR
jgi:hypothetical protein